MNIDNNSSVLKLSEGWQKSICQPSKNASQKAKKKRFSKNARHKYSKLVSCAETWRLDKKMWPFDERASCKEWTKNQS